MFASARCSLFIMKVVTFPCPPSDGCMCQLQSVAQKGKEAMTDWLGRANPSEEEWPLAGELFLAKPSVKHVRKVTGLADLGAMVTRHRAKVREICSDD